MEEDSGIYLKKPNFANKQQVTELLKSYETLPSNIITTFPTNVNNSIGRVVNNIWTSDPQSIDLTNLQQNNIFNLLGFDMNKWVLPGNLNGPVIFNLNATSTYYENRQNLTDASNKLLPFRLQNQNALPPFVLDHEKPENTITTTLLNSYGLLALQIILSNKDNPQIKSSYYLLIPGFASIINYRSLANQPLLAQDVYLKSVEQINNNEILAALDGGFRPSRAGLVPSCQQSDPNSSQCNDNSNSLKYRLQTTITKRDNNTNKGFIDVEVAYQWDIPDFVKFMPNFVGVVPNSNAQNPKINGIEYNQQKEIRVNQTWLQNITFSGFQRAQALTNQQVIYIIIAILLSVVVINFIFYAIVKTTRFFKYRK